VALALGLLSKPMVMTFPFALLLLDLWPLGRAPLRHRFLVEKWPLFVLSFASLFATSLSNLNGRTFDELPLAARLANAASAYVSYLREAIWPWPLAVAYPHVGASLSAAKLGGAILVLAGVSAAAWMQRSRRPYLLVGWCWFMGTLLPALGLLVQSGSQGWADRFMYLPTMGLSLAAAFAVSEWTTTRGRVVTAWSVAAVAVIGWTVVSRRQVRYWADDRTLFSHAVAVSPASEVAHVGLAASLADAGDLDGAESEYRAAIHLRPDFMWARLALSTLLAARGREAESAAVVEEGIRAAPDRYEFERGLLAARQGRAEEAMACYARATRRNPRHHAAFYNWGNLLAAQGRMAEAVAKYRAAARLDRDDSTIANNLALALLFSGQTDEAWARLGSALTQDPENAQLHTSAGLVLSASGRPVEAVAELREALRLNPDSADARATLESLLHPR
jgi:tetratricopeptide (TPR) repeat protein